MASQEPSSIESLQGKLYSRDKSPKPRPRRTLRPDTHQVESSWNDIDQKEEEEELVHEQEKLFPKKPVRAQVPLEKRQASMRTFLTIVLLGSFGFFVVAAGFAGYMLFVGGNPVDPENILITVQGPLVVPGGEELELQIELENRNSVPLELADLIIDFPDGTRSAADYNIDLDRYRESIGVIEPGERKRIVSRSVLFGEEESRQDIRFTLEYRVEGSNAIFIKDKQYSVTLSSAPVALVIDSVSEISAGQEVEIVIKPVSNANKVLENVMVVADYPFGFNFTSAQPQPMAGNNIWLLGDLDPGSEREIVLRGVLTGQDTEERFFRFQAGVQDARSQTEIAAVYSTAEVPIIIQRPFMQLALLFNDQKGNNDVVIPANSSVKGQIQWRNSLPDTIYDIEVTAKLSGPALDRAAISSSDGFYRSQDVSIIWNRETTQGEFERVEPGDNGTLSFDFAPLPVTPALSLTNPEMQVEVTVRGRRVSEADVPEVIETSVVRKVVMASNISLASRTLFQTGPFVNTGPTPPKAEVPTTYTLELTVANSTSDLSAVEVRTQIPWYIDWLSTFEPANADVVYNPVNGDLVWRVGDVPAGTGYTREPMRLYLQVGIEPSLSQVSTEPNLLLEQVVTGVDAFTGAQVESRRSSLTTNLVNDPAVDKALTSGKVAQ